MSFDAEELLNETQKLMQNEIEEEDQKPPATNASPVLSNKISSAGTSLSSRTAVPNSSTYPNSSITDSTKFSYINEKRNREVKTNCSEKIKNLPTDSLDVKHMEKALLDLLDDFHSGKLSAFRAGCSMEQMINIRDQQENLARLHFKLCGDLERPEDDFENAAQDKMSQLVHNLEQLSKSIENLHSNDSSKTECPFKSE